MAIKLGYLLPTREQIMQGRPEVAPMLALAERAEALGFDSIWVGDSITARPRHEPLTLLAAVAARTKRVELGTAVLLPALRNPVVLAHQLATLDQISEGRVILGIGAASDVPQVRAEFTACGVPFEARGTRMMQAIRLCRALWAGGPVDWPRPDSKGEEGLWTLRGQEIGPLPYRPGGPPIWIGGTVPATINRVGRELDGWFPSSLDASGFAQQWPMVQAAAAAHGRDPAAITGAAYLTLAIDDDAVAATASVHAFLRSYYGDRADISSKLGPCYGGGLEGAVTFLRGFIQAGATHLMLRFCGAPDRQLEMLAGVRRQLTP